MKPSRVDSVGASGAETTGASLIERHRTELLLAVVAVAVALQLVFLIQLQQTPLFHHVAGKAHVLRFWAQRLAAGQVGPGEVYHGPPLPLWYMWALFSAFGPRMGLVRLAGGACSVLACLLAGDLGRRFGGRAVGLLAALALAAYGPLYYYEAILPGTAMTLCLVLGGLAAALRAAADRGPPAWWALAGGLLGTAALSRPHCHLLVAGLGLWIVIAGAGGRRGRAAALLILLLAWAAPQGLDAAVDAWMYGRPQSSPTWGISLYLGNGPTASVGYGEASFVRGSLHDSDVGSFIAEAERRTGRQFDAAAASRYWAGEALGHVVDRPGPALARLASKTALFLHPAEIPDNWDYDFWAARLPLLPWMLRLGHVAPLALCGLWTAVRRRPRSTLLLALAAAGYIGSCALTLVLGRYRLFIAPLFLVWAAVGAAGLAPLLAGRVPQGRRQPAGARASVGVGVAVCAAVVISSLGLSLLPPPYDAAATQANAWVDLGTLYEQQGRPDRAVAAYRSSLEIDDGRFIAHIYLGDLLAEAGDLVGARRHYEAAAASGCLVPRELERLGDWCLATAGPRAAEPWFQQAIAREPGRHRPYLRLAVCRQRLGELRPAAMARSEGRLAALGLSKMPGETGPGTKDGEGP